MDGRLIKLSMHILLRLDPDHALLQAAADWSAAAPAEPTVCHPPLCSRGAGAGRQQQERVHPLSPALDT